MGNRQLTLKAIAIKTGNAISTVSTWKRGQLPRGLTAREKLSKALGVSIKYLFNGQREEDEKIFCNERKVKNVGLENHLEKEARDVFESLLVSARRKRNGLKNLNSKLHDLKL